jgi:hypothetical protein
VIGIFCLPVDEDMTFPDQFQYLGSCDPGAFGYEYVESFGLVIGGNG